MSEPCTASEAFVNFCDELGLPADMGALPGPNTPLPPTNATLHILCHEVGYGTPQREFHMLCGAHWKARESTGEHKYFYAAETWWHKHVTCEACLAINRGETQ